MDDGTDRNACRHDAFCRILKNPFPVYFVELAVNPVSFPGNVPGTQRLIDILDNGTGFKIFDLQIRFS